MDIKKELTKGLEKSIRESSTKELYTALAEMVNRICTDNEQEKSGKKLYYISAEFLVGKLL